MDTPPTAPPTIRIAIAYLEFRARLETHAAPDTCAAFERLLPFRTRLIQARWSGEAAWAPLGDMQLGVGTENGTGHPQVGQVLFYPGGVSECEILIPYGRAQFACRSGPLVGSHFLTIVDGMNQLPGLGELVLWHGAQEMVLEHDRLAMTVSTTQTNQQGTHT